MMYSYKMDEYNHVTMWQGLGFVRIIALYYHSHPRATESNSETTTTIEPGSSVLGQTNLNMMIICRGCSVDESKFFSAWLVVKSFFKSTNVCWGNVYC